MRDAELVAGVTDRPAQRHFDPLRQRSEIGLAVERCENGTAHERGAAERGQDGAGEPLYRKAAAVDEAAGFAIGRERRFVAKLDGLGLSRPVCAP
jgi:hypothetical protein